ncbi:MAG: phosphomannomutase/phosphoglucomutase [Candidatus Pacebacteria bacterium]|jgi:phosphomannomutase / phosphoglucomutase|nr:phosphomannomutase/phosphoglucomutase [Candidatus Paceibacterota bacterium]MBT4651852.1 phosphomannomutase/phosphoglucomutase [Candidatus Paceibacterota bacterium]MBT6755658.1 phosphomannomutase/phosphoglucomutase [Candidatus Paceibacterota bacterium]MBT6921400.1 phosphomannomutase/phosphoglucomutase [Candidatus Paceibacterota bacterium]
MYSIVKKIDPTIFRGYDIRGVVETQLTADVYYTLGRAYATFLSERRIFESAVGHDNRLTSEEFSEAFIQGLNDGGINTIFIGLSLSQIVYFSSYEFKTKGGAMVTASHNPANYNGLKLGVGYSDTMITEEIQYMRELVEKGEFSEGKGSRREVDLFPIYNEEINKYFNLKKKWKVVVEGCNTASGKFYPEILRKAGCEVFEQNCELDGNFPLGVPDPTEVEVLERLAEGVKKHGADIGFAYDTDGDRMAVVDENGDVLWMDTIVALFAKDVLEFIPGAPIIYNTLCSRQVTEAIEDAGGTPIVWKTGHSFIKAKVKEARSPFGGELSGHIFFMDNFYGHDDGAYASLRLLQYLERKNKKLSEEVALLTKYVSSPEIKFGLADDIKFEFIDTKIRSEFEARWPDAKYIDIDGIRMDTAEEMAIIRASQNGPYITVKFEGKTQEQYDVMKKVLKEILSKHPEIDWKSGVNTHALD